VKTFAVRYRINGKPQKLTLGRWRAPDDPKEASADPKVGEAISLASARKLAADALHQLGRGRDPVAAKKAAKKEKRQAAADTFEAITDQYFRREAGMKVDRDGNVTFDGKLRSAAARYAALKRRVFPAIGKTPVTEIRRGDIIDLLDTVRDEAGAAMADQALAFIRKVFNWYAVRNDRFISPIVKGMRQFKPKDGARKRILTDDELRAVWKVAEQKDAGPFAALVRFLLLTAARRNEAAAMTWGEVEKNGGWTLPAARNKTKEDFIRPLSKMARDILDDQPAIDGKPYVFTTGRAWLSGFSKAKKDFDKAVLAELLKHDANAKPLSNWTLHDLRRTARSLLSRAGVSSDHAERCLGHALPGVRGVYDRHEYHDEKRQAFEALAAQIERIVNPPPGNVVPFQKAGE
jgi:integrase